MTMTATAAATMIDNYANVRITLQSPTVGYTTAGNDVLEPLAASRTAIIAKIVSGSGTLDTAQATTLLDNYANAWMTLQSPTVGYATAGNDVEEPLQAIRTTIIGYLEAST